MITRQFKSSRGLITLTFDADALDSPVLIDHSNALFLTVDEAHQFYSLFADFLAEVRRVPHPKAEVASRSNIHTELPEAAPGPPHNSTPPTRAEPG